MALQMCRRHRGGCEGKHAEDTRSGELKEGFRKWKRCKCPIHVSGTFSGKFNRGSTERKTWEDARGVESAKSCRAKLTAADLDHVPHFSVPGGIYAGSF